MGIDIRPPKLDDINAIAIAANDPDVCKFMVDFFYPYNKDKGIEFLQHAID
ncbi:hypothetical protein J5893_02150 [bacterium]|nr:hypothetical protein [bacterium]